MKCQAQTRQFRFQLTASIEIGKQTRHRATKRYVKDGFLPPTLLTRASLTVPDDRLLAIVEGIAGADPALTLQAIATRLEAKRERTPRGAIKWQPSSVRMLLDRARARGLLER